MDNIFGIIIVFVALIAKILSSAKKETEHKAAEEKRKAAAAARFQAAQQRMAAAAKPASVLPPMTFSDIPGQVIAPTVHAHVKPDCNTHDKPGSLGVTSMEGKDPCHEDQLTMQRSFAEATQQEGGLTFDWTGDSMVKAVVMQEVLTRPSVRLQPVNRYLPGQRRAQ